MSAPLRVRRGVYLLPNLFTTGGLFCGFYAIIATIREEYLLSAIAVLVAQVFDALELGKTQPDAAATEIAKLTQAVLDKDPA